jgi:ubiquinone/menaquinone biosynthesis C-methylase UbiE
MNNYDQDYEYGGMLAETWDLLRGDTSQWADRYFYRKFIDQHGGRVLDVGCGTGRLLLDYLADGVDIEGVDNSPEMLKICWKKAEELGLTPILYEQSMVDLNLPHLYRVIIVPSSSFQLIIDPGDASNAMGNFFRYLEPGGILIMPFMTIWQEGNPLDTGWVKDGERENPKDGNVIRRWSRAKFDPQNQLEHTQARFEKVVGDEIVYTEFHSRSPATKWYTPEEACELYLSAGYTSLEIFSEFSLEPYQEDDHIFSIVGVKPQS